MGTHLIPREVSGEGRILYIFTPKGIAYALVGLVIGLVFRNLFEIVGASLVGWTVAILFALIGWAIGQGKIPDSSTNTFFRKVGGEPIETVIKRFIKFNRAKKIYVNKIVNEENKEDTPNT